MNAFKKHFIKQVVAMTICGCLFGGLLFLARPYAVDVLGVAVVLMGILTVFSQIPSLALAVRDVKKPGEWVNLVVTAATMVIGIMLMLAQNTAMLVALVIWSVVLPMARILLVEAHYTQARRELPRAFVGIFVFIVFLTGNERQVFTVGGWCAIALSLLYLAMGLLVAQTRFPKVLEAEYEEVEDEEILDEDVEGEEIQEEE